MLLEISIPFNIGDVVWHKDLNTGNAVHTRVRSFSVMYSTAAGCTQETTIAYFTEDGYFTHMNLQEQSVYDLFGEKDDYYNFLERF